MCFSPQASFIAGTFLTGMGSFAYASARKQKNLILFACIPFVFAIHQFVEGFIWLYFKGLVPEIYFPELASLYAVIAFCVWPFLVPVAVAQMEGNPLRKSLLNLCIVLGGFASIYTLFFILQNGVSARVDHGGIRYRLEYPMRSLIQALYGIASVGPFLISSHRRVNIFGFALAVSYCLSRIVFRTTYASVWCFFAAVLSALVIIHIYSEARHGSNAL